MSHLTEMGQLVDLITAPEDAVDLSKFSLDKWVFILPSVLNLSET